MEAAGVVGGVLHIAQEGAQLSLNLYKIAQSVGSANREVQYFAKDIALFSTILKDLGNALSKGQTSNLYREDAYQTGFGIARECEEVFQEIQGILNKFNKNGGTASVSTIFRKSRVQLLRGRLEFLKSRILLQVAVLSYAERASTSSNSTADVDGLFALKSLVLANETTKAAFQELFTKSTEGSSLGNPISISDSSRSRVTKSSATSGHQSSTAAVPPFSSIAQILHEHDSVFPPPRATKRSPVFGKKPSIPTYLPPPSRRKTYAKVWGTVDRLELALRKVEIAEWEHERLRTNLASNVKLETGLRADWTEREKTHLSKFQKALIRFGLKKEKIDQAIASIMTYHPDAGPRTEVKQVVSQNDVLFATLHHFGAPWQDDKNNADSWIVKRWIPDYLEDILWEKIYETFDTATDSQPGSYIDIADSMFISDSEEQSLGERHQAIQRAIKKVNQSNMTIERLDDPQNPHQAHPLARQSESRKSHLTVPTSVVMPRRASLAMDPPPKVGSSSFSILERRTFDPYPEITQPKVEMDGTRLAREQASTSMSGIITPSVKIIREEDYLDRPEKSDRNYRPTDNIQRHLDDSNSRRYTDVHSSSDRHDFSASTGTYVSKEQTHESLIRNPSLLHPPSLKRKSPKEAKRTTPFSPRQQPDNSLSKTPPPQNPRQWFESEKHEKSSQTVRDLLKRWTFLDLGDEDQDENLDEQHQVRDEGADGAWIGRVSKGAGGGEGERLEGKRHGRGGGIGDGGGADGGERSGDGGEEQRKRVKRF